MGYSVLHTYVCDICGETRESSTEKEAFASTKPFGWLFYPILGGVLVCGKHMIIAKLVDMNYILQEHEHQVHIGLGHQWIIGKDQSLVDKQEQYIRKRT